MKDCNYLQQKYTINTYPDRGIVLARGEGVYLYDSDGKKYLDLMSNYGVSILGYGNAKITQAVAKQFAALPTLHGSFNNDQRALASEALVKRCGDGYAKVYWSNSGAEAIETALKFAVLATGKKRFIVCANGYHGKSLGALSATMNEKYRKPFEPLLWKFVQIPFNDIDALKQAIDAETAAFLVEPIQGESGILTPDANYLSKIKKICDEKEILLIIDEIQTGAGRAGEFLASQQQKICADILCLGKGLAGGVPVGATVVSGRVANVIPKHIHTSTLGGNPLACSGVIATLKELDEKLLSHVQDIGTYFINKLKNIDSEQIVAVRGIGCMIGMEVKDKRNTVLKLLQDEKILAIPAGENVVRFLPPLILEKKHVDDAITKITSVLKSL
ncbi:MAG TPA: aspartate aminotransferase family protein [Patescibacteria group bacterium]|nr:aspartate aminotransferase family protein [Patescibacteria group bacterium]